MRHVKQMDLDKMTFEQKSADTQLAQERSVERAKLRTVLGVLVVIGLGAVAAIIVATMLGRRQV